MKKYFFISGLPRSGNTLLSSLLNQNPDITVSGQSIIPEIFFRVEEIRNTSWFENFPYEKGLENVSKNIFNNYFKNHKTKYIIDRGPWTSEYNYNILKKYLDYDFKIVCFDTNNWVGNGRLIPSGPLREKLNSLKNKSSSEWREYSTQCMIEIMENKRT